MLGDYKVGTYDIVLVAPVLDRFGVVLVIALSEKTDVVTIIQQSICTIPHDHVLLILQFIGFLSRHFLEIVRVDVALFSWSFASHLILNLIIIHFISTSPRIKKKQQFRFEQMSKILSKDGCQMLVLHFKDYWLRKSQTIYRHHFFILFMLKGLSASSLFLNTLMRPFGTKVDFLILTHLGAVNRMNYPSICKYVRCFGWFSYFLKLKMNGPEFWAILLAKPPKLLSMARPTLDGNVTTSSFPSPVEASVYSLTVWFLRKSFLALCQISLTPPV